MRNKAISTLLFGLVIACHPIQKVYWDGANRERKKGVSYICQPKYCHCFNSEDQVSLMSLYNEEYYPLHVHIQKLQTLEENSCIGIFFIEEVGRRSATWLTPFLKFENKIELYNKDKDIQKRILDEFMDLYGKSLTEKNKEIIEYYFSKETNTHGEDYPYLLLIEENQ